MAIKKTTAVKKSDPPSKKKSGPPNRSLSPATNLIAGKDFGKLNRKTTDYYYTEKVPMGGQGGIKNSSDLTKEQNNHYYKLIISFYELTSVPILFNTSFNLAGDCIVETVDNAIDTLEKSSIDYLYLPEFGLLVSKM